MPRIKKTYDIFLSYSSDLQSQAEVVAKKFADAGLAVFDLSELGPAHNVVEETWQALAESWALVVIVKPGATPPSVAVEIGAASAWQKPIYILLEGEGEHHLPAYFSKYETFKSSEIGKVVELISKGLKPLNDKDRQALAKAYVELRIPTDRLLREPTSIERLKNTLWKESGLMISGERMMQELIRLRKRGRLPTIGNRK
ncbi:MAG: toll/interleukin-1 receptor domain-containing protein [Phycisphaerae bacterium]|nr:toll/interleukin-1 receptor domain-containing protein [Phycisphaerae bacterium]